MSFELKQLGTYRIERTDEYIPGCLDNSYAEMIRVKGSKSEPPFFMVPSHLYKYSETELALYLKNRKNLWRPLGKLLNQNVDISDEEIILRFPIGMFSEMAKIVPFVRKAIRKNPMSEVERLAMINQLSMAREQRLRGMNENDPRSGMKGEGGTKL